MLQIICPSFRGFAGSSTQVWSEMLRAIVTLKYHPVASRASHPLLLCDVTAVAKVCPSVSK